MSNGGVGPVRRLAIKAQAFAEPYRWPHDEWFTPTGFPKGSR
jgi:hypothetical protein